jgi:hypothetical protein
VLADSDGRIFREEHQNQLIKIETDERFSLVSIPFKSVYNQLRTLLSLLDTFPETFGTLILELYTFYSGRYRRVGGCPGNLSTIKNLKTEKASRINNLNLLRIYFGEKFGRSCFVRLKKHTCSLIGSREIGHLSHTPSSHVEFIIDEALAFPNPTGHPPLSSN